MAFSGESPPLRFRRSRSTSKQIIAVFFAKSGHVPPAQLQDRKTINADWYISICLPKIFEAWTARRQNNGTRCLLLHHYNASAHTAAATPVCLEANCFQLVTQTPYFPGLAPCDFFLFPQVKQQLKGK